uniref:molybdopterin biosynthesis protein n=1 Tax=Gloiopeltis furcata TaxID=42017 RepID=UPI0028D8A5B6|nr:molybdopterin biosynthesis protein [Gloiopeltis furcata]WMP13965.1 molybdopterin biosynthesis protein [Gloiopeltis furcata]
MLNPVLNKICLSKEEYKMYARHFTLDGIGVSGQKRIKRARVLIVGAGGLGCPSILYLVTSGIGFLGVIDNDKVSLSNLHRQILYNRLDINTLKVQCVKTKLEKVNPTCNIEIYNEALTVNNALGIIQKYDLILDASDNFETRYLIDFICERLHKIHVYGAVQNFEGHISVFNYKNGPKYSDLYPQYLRIQEKNCNDSGVMGVLTGLVGLLQATEVIKIITGKGKTLSGYLLIYNMLSMSFKKKVIRLKTRNHTINPKYEEKLNHSQSITMNHLDKKIQNKESIVIVDVRQNTEFRQKHIYTAINIPLKEIPHKNTIKNILNKVRDKTLVIYCSNNSRSIIASKILNRYKINNLRIKDGLNMYKNENHQNLRLVFDDTDTLRKY